jgi:hypothetical protein
MEDTQSKISIAIILIFGALCCLQRLSVHGEVLKNCPGKTSLLHAKATKARQLICRHSADTGRFAEIVEKAFKCPS